MIEEFDYPEEALKYLNILIKGANDFVASNQIDYLIELIKEDMEDQSYQVFKTYLNLIFNSLPVKILPYFLENLIKLQDPYWFIQKLINFLIKANRPIYQIKGLQLIQKIKDDSYIPYVFPLIYHAHLPLQKEAIKTIMLNGECSEKLLESDLKSRSEKKRMIARKVLKKVNPDNLRLMLEELESSDFIERIHAIKILAASGDRKWISKITNCLNDHDLSVKKAAIDALSQLGGKKAKKILNQKLLIEDYLPLRNIIQEHLENF